MKRNRPPRKNLQAARDKKHAKLEHLFATTSLSLVQIAADVGMSIGMAREYVQSHKLKRPVPAAAFVDTRKQWKPPLIISYPVKPKVTKISEEALLRADLVEQTRREREHLAKRAKKIVELYTKYGIGVPDIAERYGMPNEAVWRVLRAQNVTPGTLANRKTGPALANQRSC